MYITEILPNSIFITIFPPGCGGNHLANLLSLSSIFQKRFNADNYENHLYVKYKFNKNKGNHHFGPLQNLQINDWQLVYNEFKKYPGVPIVCSHAAEYYNFLERFNKIPTFDLYAQKHILLFSFPTEDSIAFKRFYELRHGEGVDVKNLSRNFTINEYKRVYNVEVFENELTKRYKDVINIEHTSAIKILKTFDTDSFVQMNGYEYVQSFFKETYNIALPDFGNKLHQYWYNNIVLKLGLTIN